MARANNIAVQNNFVKGLLTEATVLTFPENACTDVDNCVIEAIGTVGRRLGIDIEGGSANTTQTIVGTAITEFLWKNVASEGDLTYVVEQIGNTLHFYKVVSGESLSSQKHASTIDLTTFAPAGITTVATIACQFAAGNGYLFVANANLNPFYVTYSIAGNTFTGVSINVQTRDFQGIPEGVPDAQRPTTLTDAHHYNLSNQGWPSRYKGSSSTSILIGTGSKVFTTAATLGILVGDRVRIYSSATPGFLGASTSTGNIMIGTVTAYAGTSLTVNVTATNGSGTLTDWNIVEEPDYIDAWPAAGLGGFPNNQDVWWQYKNSSDVFAPLTKILDVLLGTTQAPKGHFILNAFSGDRSAAAGIPGLTGTSAGTDRPSTIAFFAGRVFYAGVQNLEFNSKIYFTQVLDDISKVGFCYQENDPTSEKLFDLLPTDGGYIDIIEAGTVLKMVPVLNNLMVVCTNGTWFITGSQGLGFVANDYSVHKVSAIPGASASSFVDVAGTPYWWTYEGIYTVTFDQQTNVPRVVSLTDFTIRSYYNDIPLDSKNFAKGAYDPEQKIIQWIFRSTSASAFNDRYTYDRMLTFNLLTQAFYPWSVSSNKVSIHGLVAVRAQSGTFSSTNVQSAAGVNQVVAGGNQVVVFHADGGSGLEGIAGTTIKYFCTFVSGGNTKATYAECYRTDYKDWLTYDAIGETFLSFFITGYMVHGQAMRKFQANYVNFFSEIDVDSQFRVQGQYNFSTSGSSGKWSTAQVMAGFFKSKPKRIKLRGHGISMQIRVESIANNPFKLVGWAIFETGNQWV